MPSDVATGKVRDAAGTSAQLVAEARKRTRPYYILLPATSLHGAVSRFLVIIALVRHTGSCDVGAEVGHLLSMGALFGLVSSPAIGWLQDTLSPRPLMVALTAVQAGAQAVVAASSASSGPHIADVVRQGALQAQMGVQGKALRNDMGCDLPASDVSAICGSLSAWTDATAEVLQTVVLLGLAWLSPQMLPSAVAQATIGVTLVALAVLLTEVQGHERGASDATSATGSKTSPPPPAKGTATTTTASSGVSSSASPSFLTSLWKLATDPSVMASTLASALLFAFWMQLFFVMPASASPLGDGATLENGCAGNLASQITTGAWGYAAFLPGSLWSVWLSARSPRVFTRVLFWAFMLFALAAAWAGIVSEQPALVSVSSVTAYYLARYLSTVASSLVPPANLGAHGVLFGLGMAGAQALAGASAEYPFDTQVVFALGLAAAAAACVAVLGVTLEGSGGAKAKQI